MNIGFVTCDITSEQLIEALKQNVSILLIVYVADSNVCGRVRLASVDEGDFSPSMPAPV